jgi:tetratricopeptide (TPR) repeat protein
MTRVGERRGLSPPNRYGRLQASCSEGISPSARQCSAIALLLLLLSTAISQAQPPEPYALDVVILRSDHRFLATEAFRERFPRIVADRIRLALGPVVQVTTTESHPLADTLRRDGLGAPLDAVNAVTARRTCFLRVRHEAGEFVVESRYVDGYTGLVSPLVASARTGDRDQLAPLAASLIADSFAVIGDVGKVDGDRAELRLLGGFGGDVRPGDIFAVSRLGVQEGRWLGQPIAWLFLEAEKAPQAGVVPCRIHRRYSDSRLEAAPGTIYRALRLPAGHYPLELRLVERETRQPATGVQAKIRSAGREVDVESDAQGLVRSRTPLDRLAIVTLRSGGKDIARVPVPLLGDRPVCELRIGAESDEETAHEVRREQWSARIIRDLALVEQRIGELPFELGRSLEDAKRHANETIKLIDSEVKDMRAEERALERVAPGTTKRGDADLARFAEQRARLVETIRGFDQAIAEREASDQRKKEAIALAQRANLFAGQARFDEALVLYDQALAKGPELKKVRDLADALRAGWELHGEDHKQSRKFLVETWPRLSAEEIPTHLGLAEQALETCRKVGDKLTPRCFVAANVEHRKKIVELTEALRRSQQPEAGDQLRMWRETVAKLRRLDDLAKESSTIGP